MAHRENRGDLHQSFSLKLAWIRNAEEAQSQDHIIEFGSGQIIKASAAPQYMGSQDKINPEESLLAAISACHMLSFLTVARKMRLEVISYSDNTTAKLGKNRDNRIAITHITMAPQVSFKSCDTVSEARLAKMHHIAHNNCFIANSLSSDVQIDMHNSSATIPTDNKLI
ncbi:OsmC family protein [Shewanella psychrotolerans]|uniref:OsmC family protein n=1 Tax=Shewanella psychrotolerans TaxID=2864206 RepID=UPI003D9C9B5C